MSRITARGSRAAAVPDGVNSVARSITSLCVAREAIIDWPRYAIIALPILCVTFVTRSAEAGHLLRTAGTTVRHRHTGSRSHQEADHRRAPLMLRVHLADHTLTIRSCRGEYYVLRISDAEWSSVPNLWVIEGFPGSLPRWREFVRRCMATRVVGTRCGRLTPWEVVGQGILEPHLEIAVGELGRIDWHLVPL